MAEQEETSQAAVRCQFKTMCGGQALIEGIMMRGPKKQAIVVRRQDGGLETKLEDLRFIKDVHPILGVPMIRGVVNFVDSLVAGVKALMYSADFYPDDDTPAEPSKFDKWLEAHFSDEKLMKLVVGLSVTAGIVLSVVLFFLLPTLLGTAVTLVTDSILIRNLTESLLRVAIFILYLILCSKLKDMARVFQYHGAEHKTIFCYEAGLPLTVENVRTMPRHHPRCGTSFLFVVIIVAIIVSCIVFSIFQVQNVWLRMLAHLILLPVVVGISYEFNRYVGRHDTAVTRFLTAPGLWLQNWTTNEPDDSMIEVGIEALRLVLPEEKGTDAW